MTAAPKQRVTLSMIVKNEARVIARCLASVRPLITSWVIVDTGSTDGTQGIVEKAMNGVPGKLYERPWRDFGSNRTEALELAKEFDDYALVIDADDTLEYPPSFALPELTADAYQLLVRDGATVYWRSHIFSQRLDYRYEGVLHEVLTSSSPRTEVRLEGLVYRRSVEGARSADPKKYHKDAAILAAALAKEPTNARTVFYLAQSYRDAGELEQARNAYRVRTTMGGWDEELWYARLEVAKLSARLRAPAEEVVSAYLAAYEARPSRAESLSYLATYLRESKRVVAAYPFARVALEIPRPSDRLFVDDSVYAWRAKDEFAVAAYWVGNYRDALVANEALLAGKELPASERPRIEANIGFCRSKLKSP